MTSDRLDDKAGNRLDDARGGGRTGGSDDRRSDPALAAVVDEAIRFDAERGAALAWAYLARHGVPPETILRVLAAPAAGQVPRRAPRAGAEGAAFRR
ncbi:hypothetical protein GJV26_27290 [Massilia dura]|uniref:Uncharacterized protein n=1 Tax=Pseudoduganella dura TaxID=321982 RepID=A0A6I3XNT3_9BURK|nr:hypothetical protein [Pseudoduganella dura]MUI16133.1 hypothetical protein [Pseudoduganella dura]GGY15510.1 hypothetical protein GCM10007386_51870 [Pseudoduganella dura]